jgi:Uma2 family endonuclease
MSAMSKVVTADELQRFPDDDCRYELVDGRLVRMSPVGYQHARTVTLFLLHLQRHVQDRGLGVAVTELGFKIGSNPDTVRAPDIAFIAAERLPPTGWPGFFNGPPDVAVEVLSPEDRRADLRSKVTQYLAQGVRLVLVLDPRDRTAVIYRREAPPAVVRGDAAEVDLEDVVPEFCCRLDGIFE